MHLSRLVIQNFRSIKDLTIDFQKDLNVFVGKNNTGKSSIIDAIRLALSTFMNNPNPIRISEDDFYKDINQPERSESFTIKMEFAGLSESQRVKFFEIVDFDLVNPDNSIAKLEYTASWPLKNSSRVSVKRTGGPEGPDRAEVPQKIMEQFSIIYLPALRDAETALTAGNKSQLANLLKNLAQPQNREDVEAIYKESNEALSKEEFISDIVKGINSITQKVAFSDAQTSKIVTADSDFTKILRTLQVQMDGNPVKDLFANGLGSNNLLYIAVVLQYLTSIGYDECPILLIEEPEAHLHPQMVISLSRYLSENLTPQTIITTHSPTLVTDIPIDNIHLLFKKDDIVRCNALKNAGFNDAEKKQFRRLMDITRSTLYFAKGVILVEGISEAILLPILAQREKIDLREKQISVIPICGVNFEIFKKLFKEDTFDIPVSIITDADPQIDQSAGWKNARVLNKNSICDRTKKLQESFEAHNEARVYNSQITLEYDLAIASNDNPLIITEAWEKCFKKDPKTLNINIINNCKSLEEKAETIWRVVCLSDNRHGKGDLASNLAELLDERVDKKNKDSAYKYNFTVPNYIKEAISFVNEKLKKCQVQAQNSEI